jgi:hypothetical protein
LDLDLLGLEVHVEKDVLDTEPAIVIYSWKQKDTTFTRRRPSLTQGA